MKPIETFYNGYRFRSRLEARWAVFFDSMGIEYQYEPEGFVLSNKQAYLPDFYLPTLDIYVEVKPAHLNFISHPNDEEVTFGNEEKYGYFMHDITSAGHGAWFVFGDPVDAFLREKHGGHGSNEMFCQCTCSVKEFDPEAECHCDGKSIHAAECTMHRLVSGKILALSDDFAIWACGPLDYPKVQALSFDLMMDTAARAKKEGNDTMERAIGESAKRTFEACEKARQARFEHGETPTI